MASPEHDFLSRQVGDSLERFSKLDLYGVTESDRSKYDYSATLLRDFSRPLAAQVAWKHLKGVDKDVRTLVTSDAAIKLYILQDDARYRRVYEEAVRDYKSSNVGSMAGFRLVLLPTGFDADNADDRAQFKRYRRRNG